MVFIMGRSIAHGISSGQLPSAIDSVLHESLTFLLPAPFAHACLWSGVKRSLERDGPISSVVWVCCMSR